MYYKIIYSKVAYVKASSRDEAFEKAMDEDYIFTDEDIEHVEPSCRSDVVNAWNMKGDADEKEDQSRL